MRYIEAPTHWGPLYDGEPAPSLFLAGGITDCPDWQAEFVDLLADTYLVLLNPRRADFPIHDPSAAEAQITWEHQHLRLATAISFWFAAEALQPIALYELGAWTMAGARIFVGAHPDYVRRQDVEIQTKLAKPNMVIADSLEALSGQIHNWLEEPYS